VKSERAVRCNLSEADLLFIQYTRGIFDRYDKDGSGRCQPSEVRQALTYFNIFLSTSETASVMGMFLRDEGQKTPCDELQLALSFDQFTLLLCKVNVYTVHAKSKGRGVGGLVARLQALAPSKRLDCLARMLSPAAVALMLPTFYLFLPLYQ